MPIFACDRLVQMLVLLSCTLGTLTLSADDLIDVIDSDSVLISFYRVPVVVHLAEVAPPGTPELEQAAVARIRDVLDGKRFRAIHREEFGLAADRTGRVVLEFDETSINEILLAEGLVRLDLPDDRRDRYARRMRTADKTAADGNIGVHGSTTAVATATTAQPSAASARSPSEPEPTVAAVSELGSSTYYPADAPEARSIHPQRRIEYPSIAAAEQAGKRPAVSMAAAGGDDMPSAQAALERGRELLASAIDAGNTGRRDQLYQQAFADLSVAVRILSAHVEANQNDSQAAEQLREAMQMRYSAMKNRRS